jgi:hypothetical protein
MALENRTVAALDRAMKRFFMGERGIPHLTLSLSAPNRERRGDVAPAPPRTAQSGEHRRIKLGHAVVAG